MENQTTDCHEDIYQWHSTISTNYEQDVHEYYVPNWINFVLAVLFSMLIIVTIVGNTLVIAAVATTRRLRSVTNCFVSSLAAADLLVGLAVMPPAVMVQLNGGSWELGEVLCICWVSLDILLCTASILSLCAISIDRYLAVTQPLIYTRRRRSKRLAGGMIVAVWIMAAAITSPPLLGWFPRAKNQDFTQCSYNMDSSYVIFSSMGSFFLPMLVMLYVYFRISCVIARRHRDLESTSRSIHRRRNVLFERVRGFHSKRKECQDQNVTTTIDKPTSAVSDEGEGESANATNVQSTTPSKKLSTVRDSQQSSINRVAKETKTAVTLAVVVGGFVACWLPFFVLYLATPFIPTKPPNILMLVLTWLGWINSAINPFIYAFYSADFRIAFWRLTFRKCSKNRTNSNVDRKLPVLPNWRKETTRTRKLSRTNEP